MRPLRIEYPGAWYHVMNRGRGAEAIFGEEGDFDRFVAKAKRTLDPVRDLVPDSVPQDVSRKAGLHPGYETGARATAR